jgi:hypothetical protein
MPDKRDYNEKGEPHGYWESIGLKVTMLMENYVGYVNGQHDMVK